ncbi:MAG: virion core protein, T7 gp14 family [Janthinobacterium lividum]
MCEPTTLALIGTAVSVAGAGVGAYSAIQQGNARSDAANYQSAVDKNNATIAGWNADIAEQSQVAKTQAIQRTGSLRAGAQRAALAAGGVDAASGSSLDVLDATETDTARAASASQYQGDLTGYGYRTQQQNFLGQATMASASGANAATAGLIGAGSTLLSGAGQVADKWYRYKDLMVPTKPDQTGVGVMQGGLY